jgi:hypothetical protein
MEAVASMLAAKHGSRPHRRSGSQGLSSPGGGGSGSLPPESGAVQPAVAEYRYSDGEQALFYDAGTNRWEQCKVMNPDEHPKYTVVHSDHFKEVEAQFMRPLRVNLDAQQGHQEKKEDDGIADAVAEAELLAEVEAAMVEAAMVEAAMAEAETAYEVDLAAVMAEAEAEVTLEDAGEGEGDGTLVTAAAPVEAAVAAGEAESEMDELEAMLRRLKGP